jgi:hypothetical protein
MVELLFPVTLRQDMRDVFDFPRGLGLWGVFERLKNFTFLNPLIYLYYYILTPLSTL